MNNSQYKELFLKGVIEFDKLMLDKYKIIGLDEIEAIILMKLYSALRNNKKVLSVKKMISTMTISEKECSNKIVDLVHRGYITLELSDISAKEEFNLNETFKRLMETFDNNPKKSLDDVESKVSRIVKFIEKETNKMLTSLELDVVSRWIVEYNYDENEIREVILKSLKNKKTSVTYIDRLLLNNKKEQTTSFNEDIQDLFKKVYDK